VQPHDYCCSREEERDVEDEAKYKVLKIAHKRLTKNNRNMKRGLAVNGQ